MNNSKDVNSQLTRMKSLMKFGINEGKNIAYTGVEYQKVGADGKLYGIVREGAKYYIKTSPNKKGQLAENFEYIGGFRNRKDNEYKSFAEAQKQFDLKMMSINEANAPEKKIMVESWNPDRQEELTVESTERLRKEISRERQIMMNASRINEKKEQNLKPIAEEACSCEGCEADVKAQGKNNIGKQKAPQTGDAKNAVKDFKAVKDSDMKDMNEAAEPLAWHSTGKDASGNIADEYLDKSHGTEIGDSAPFDDAKGKDITEDIDDIDGEADVEDDSALADDEDGFGAEDDDFESEDSLDSEEGDFEDDDFEGEENETDPDIHDLQDQIADLSDKLDSILAAVGGDEPTVDSSDYEDDDLYGDEDDDFDDDEMPMESRNRRGVQVYESRAFRKMMVNESRRNRARRLNEDEKMKAFSDAGRVPSGNMNKLNDFGKHPAYQKKVMELPKTAKQEFPGYYDMNDESVYSENPYGEKIGSSAPFVVDPEEMENAIAESIKRNLGKKFIR